MSIPALARAVRFGETHLPRASAEERLEGSGEVRVDHREGFFELLLRDLVELRDGLLRVGDRLQQVLAFAAHERKALFALVVLFERQHVHRAHGFDALLQLAILRVGGRQLRTAKQRGLFGHQVLWLGVQLIHAQRPQMFAFGIVARTFHFESPALLAQLGQMLPCRAQRVVYFSNPRPAAIRFLFDLGLPRFQALAFGAKRFGLLLFLFILQEKLLLHSAAMAVCCPASRVARAKSSLRSSSMRPASATALARRSSRAAFSARRVASSSC